MNEDEMKIRLWYVRKDIAALRFEYYELFSANRNIAMKLFGYKSKNPEKFNESLVKKMEFYVFGGRNDIRAENSGSDEK